MVSDYKQNQNNIKIQKMYETTRKEHEVPSTKSACVRMYVCVCVSVLLLLLLLLSIYWNPKELVSNAYEGIDLPVRGGFPPSCSLYRLPAECVTQIKGGSSYLKRSGLAIGSSHFKCFN